MDIENIAKLKEWLQSGATHTTYHFNMAVGLVPKITDIDQYEYAKSDTLPETCQSACCLAGAAVSILAPEDWLKALTAHVDPENEADWSLISEQAQELLGLAYHQARELFEPTLYDIDRSKLTVADAIQALDNLVADPDQNPWRHIQDADL